MRRLPKLSLLSLCFLGISACATTQSRPHGKLAEKPLEKEGQKLPPTPVLEAPPAPAADLAGLSQRIGNLQQPLSDSDIREATALYPTKPGTQEEAIFVLVQMRLFQKDLERKTGFQSADLYNNEAPAASAAGLSLEGRFKDLEVDLATAIRSNPFLKNLPSLQLAQTLARNTQNSPTFAQDLNSAIQQSGAQWADELSRPAEAPAAQANAETPATTPSVPAAEVAAGVAVGTTAPVPQGEADIAQSDSILVLAQKLADKGEYKEALEQTARIPKEDPFHAQAAEKAKIYSNRAVQDLRQRAAEAFSNALPMTDSRAKVSYLKQAKNLLEKALSDFPQADQLDTVRENLAVINHDLEAVDKSGT